MEEEKLPALLWILIQIFSWFYMLTLQKFVDTDSFWGIRGRSWIEYLLTIEIWKVTISKHEWI